MNKSEKIYIAGHTGLVGSAILRALLKQGYDNLIYVPESQLDLTDQSAVRQFFDRERPDYVFLAAAKVGGIGANYTYPAEFIRNNLFIEANVIDSAYRYGTKKLLFMGSSCIYPRLAAQPIKEEYFMTGTLEPTNEYYATAKIAGIEMCDAYNRQYGTDFISVMPTNLYGPGDNFDLASAHVLPALIRKFHDGKVNELPCVEVWGTGTPLREFLHVDDLAEACVLLMKNYNNKQIGKCINIGAGEDLTIEDLALLIKKIVGFKGELVFNPDKPDGTPRKLLDISRIKALGWSPRIPLEEGIRAAYQWFLDNVAG